MLKQKTTGESAPVGFLTIAKSLTAQRRTRRYREIFGRKNRRQCTLVPEMEAHEASHSRLIEIWPSVSRRLALCLLLAFLHQAAAAANLAVKEAATKFVPGFIWHEDSILTGDFSCGGLNEQAILGTNSKEIAIAVFLNGTRNPPQVLRYSASVRNPSLAALGIEDLDYDPEKEAGEALPGFRRSKTCRGLNLSDGETDSAHIYWNRKSHRFVDWSR